MISVFCFIASQCVSLRVKLKNDALKSQEVIQGIFQPSKPVNGRPSWTSASQAIWYIPEFGQWGIGNLGNIGTKFRGIKSIDVDELVEPQNIMDWQYYNVVTKWNIPDDKNDIIIECINCE